MKTLEVGTHQIEGQAVEVTYSPECQTKVAKVVEPVQVHTKEGKHLLSVPCDEHRLKHGGGYFLSESGRVTPLRWLATESIRGTVFKGLDLTDADFREFNLAGCIFWNCTLVGATFADANLWAIEFDDCNCANATFDDAKTFCTYFRGTELAYSSFNDVNVGEIRFVGPCGFDQADFRKAKLTKSAYDLLAFERALLPPPKGELCQTK